MTKLPTRPALLASSSCVFRCASRSSACLRSVASMLTPTTLFGCPLIIRNERAYLNPSNLAARTNDTIFRATFASPFAEGVAPGKLYLLNVFGMYGGQIFTAWELDRPL